MKNNARIIAALMIGLLTITGCNQQKSSDPEPLVPACETFLLGDKDGFGMGLKSGDAISIQAGTSLPIDHRSAKDPYFTDVYSPTVLYETQAKPVSFSYTHEFSVRSNITRAVLHLNTLGIQDGDKQVFQSDTDLKLYLDGREIPFAFDGLDQFNYINGAWSETASLVDIEIPASMLSLLSDGKATFKWEVYQLNKASQSTDAFMIDYSELEVCTGSADEHR